MTCGVAVKRPFDYEAYLPDAADEVEIKRSRQQIGALQPHCSPFRPQLGTLATSLPQAVASATQNPLAQPNLTTNQSPTGSSTLNTGDLIQNRCRLTSNQLESYLKAEVQYLRRRKLIPRHKATGSSTSSQTTEGVASNSGGYRTAAKSPSPSHSGSDSEGELGIDGKSVAAASQASGQFDGLYDRPQFSLTQVKQICERLLNEQAMRLRYEYEAVLKKKLEEQYEQFVQFMKETVKDQPGNSVECSYLS